jgi:pilus assembly protein Flp/PilA
MLKSLSRKSKKGQSLAEYGLILALISIVCIGIMTLMGGNLRRVFTELNTAITGVTVKTQ